MYPQIKAVQKIGFILMTHEGRISRAADPFMQATLDI